MYTVSSTHSGAAILWIGAELFTFIALIPVFLQWVRFEERKAARYDAKLDAELAASGATTVPFTEQRSTGPPTTSRMRRRTCRCRELRGAS